MIRTGIKLLILCGLLMLPMHARAEDLTPEEEVKQSVRRAEQKNFINVLVENDLLGGGTDQYYTSGVRLSYFNVNTPVPNGLDEIADAIPTFDLNDTTSTFFTLGQNLYTPDDISIAAAQPNDRPWAAFLYGSAGLVTLEDNHIDELEVTLGVIGPEALGEQTQKFIHKHLSDSPLPKGWKNQLDFEPGLIISAQRRWPRLWYKDFSGFRLQAEPNINVSLGNVYTYAGTGLNIAFGPYEGYLQDTPSRVRPGMERIFRNT